LFLIGMGLEAVRAGLFAFVTNYPLMVAIQLLDGISGSIINVLTAPRSPAQSPPSCGCRNSL